MQMLQCLIPRNPACLEIHSPESKPSTLPNLVKSKMQTRRDPYSWSVQTVSMLYHAQFTSGQNQVVPLAWKLGHRLKDSLGYSPYPASQGCVGLRFLSLSHPSKWIPARLTLTGKLSVKCVQEEFMLSDHIRWWDSYHSILWAWQEAIWVQPTAPRDSEVLTWEVRWANPYYLAQAAWTILWDHHQKYIACVADLTRNKLLPLVSASIYHFSASSATDLLQSKESITKFSIARKHKRAPN